MVNLVKNPIGGGTLHPITNCLDVCLNTDSYLVTAATAAEFRVEVDAAPMPIGEIFVFFGQTFTVGTSNTFNTFVWSATDSIVTVLNIQLALNQNALLSGMYTRINNSLAPSNSDVTFRWNETGFNSDFVFDGAMPNWLVRSSGTDAVYQNGYQINYQLMGRNTQGSYFPVLPVQSFIPILKTDGTTADTCIEFNFDIRQLLKTRFVWANQAILFDTDCFGAYAIKYGDQQTKTQGCGVDFMGVSYTPFFEVCNAVCQPYETAGVFQPKDAKLNQYNHQKVSLAKFFTGRPRDKSNTIYVCDDEFINLWFYTPTPNSLYSVNISFLNAAGVQIGNQQFTPIAVNTERKFIIIPASIRNFAAAPALTKGYAITVSFDGAPVSETLNFKVESCGCDREQVFFVCDKLGYDTMKFTRVDSLSLSVSQSEICLDIPCGGTVYDDLQSGLQNVGTEAYETFTLISEKYPNTPEYLNWFIQFKKSESRYILRKLSDDTLAPFSLVLSSGDVQIYQFGDVVQLSVTGRYGFNLETQPQG